MTLPLRVVGIDISKPYLDCFLHPAGLIRRFCNDRQGHEALVSFVRDHQAFCVLEATGPYDRALGARLHREQLAFHRANPRKARQFARAAGFLAKTDRVDARMLAVYGTTLPLSREVAPDAARQALKTLVERRDQLVAMRKSERIRSAQPHHEDIEESLQEMIEAFDRQIGAIDARIDALVRQTKSLADDRAILRSAPGIGPHTANVLMAYMPELGHRDRRSIAALAGLAPIVRFRRHARQAIHMGR
jgi:transposase